MTGCSSVHFEAEQRDDGMFVITKVSREQMFVTPSLVTAAKWVAPLVEVNSASCSTCGKSANDPEALTCSNPFHLERK